MGAVVGVDASLASTGLAVLGAGEPAFRRIRTKPSESDVASQVRRVRAGALEVVRALDEILHAAPAVVVDLVVMEMPAFGKNNSGTHILAGHWWMVAHALERRAPIARVATGTLKRFATGNGGASKQEVHAAAVRAFPGGVPSDFKKGNDVADASVLAAMGATWLGMEVGGVFAPSGMDSVQAVRWPLIEGKAAA